MRSPVRSVGALPALVLLCLAQVANAQLPDIGGGDLGGGLDSGSLPDGGAGGLGLPGTEVLPDGLGLDALRGVVVDHAAALKAVQDRRALPLNDLLKGVAKIYRGEIIDVRLVRSPEMLFYEVKMLDARGSVSLVYFDAATGKPLTQPKR